MNTQDEYAGLSKTEAGVPTIKTERLICTLPSADAAPGVLRYLAENDRYHAPRSPPRPDGLLTESYWRRRLEQSREEFRNDESLRFFLYLNDMLDDAPIGTCSFTQIRRGPLQSCNLGYDLAERCVGQGFMTEALLAAIDYVFTQTGLHRIEASYQPRNERSGRLLRRLGFTVEGYARDYLFIGDVWHDHILTSLMNPSAPPPAAEERAKSDVSQPVNDEALDDELSSHLLRLEQQLIDACCGKSADTVSALLADDFEEFGRSGRTYDKNAIMQDLSNQLSQRVEIHDFRLRSLSDGVALVTYRSSRLGDPASDELAALRSSIWRREQGGWRMVFHQGTPTSV